MEKPNLDKLKNKGTAATAATIAAAGVLIGGAFEAPADILQNDDMAPAPAPIIEVLDAQAEPDGGDGEDEAVADEEEEKKRGGVRAKTRELILRMPLAVRACVVVPLWCVGWAIISLASLLWAGVLSPIGSEILDGALLPDGASEDISHSIHDTVLLRQRPLRVHAVSERIEDVVPPQVV